MKIKIINTMKFTCLFLCFKLKALHKRLYKDFVRNVNEYVLNIQH